MQAYKIANLRSPFYQHHLQSELRKDMARVHPQLDIKPLHLQSGYARIKDCDHTQSDFATSTAIRTMKNRTRVHPRFVLGSASDPFDLLKIGRVERPRFGSVFKQFGPEAFGPIKNRSE